MTKVVDAIILGAKQGQFAPGQRLIAADLAAEFDVSRAPVREALHVLAGEGIVELIPNRGAKMRTLTAKEMVDLMQYTEAICALGVRLATQKIDGAKNRALIEKYGNLVREAWNARDAAAFIESLYDFHDVVNEMSGNSYLQLTWRRSPYHFFLHLLSNRLPGRHWEPYMQNYERIFKTMLKGDVQAATAAFSDHMQWAIGLLED